MKGATPRRPKPANPVASSTSVKSTPRPAPASSESASIYLPTARAFTAWLETNHGTAPGGLWLAIAKKGSEPALAAAAAAAAEGGDGKEHESSALTYPLAVDVALCHGWIDGQRRGHAGQPDSFFEQRFTPRRKGSLWSARNVGRIEALTAAGKMHPTGLREVEAAKADGRWERAYAGSKEMVVAKDLEAALGLNGKGKGVGVGDKGRKFWDGLNRSQRYSFCWRVETAKTPEGRRRMIERVVQMVKEGRTF